MRRILMVASLWALGASCATVGTPDDETRVTSTTPETVPSVADAAVPEGAGDAPPVGPAAWERYQHERRFDCVGPLEEMEGAYLFEAGMWKVSLYGHYCHLQGREGAARAISVGVLGAPKDALPATLANIEDSLGWFRDAGVGLVVVNGDVGYSAEDMEATLVTLAGAQMPVFVHAGNADPLSTFNRVLKVVSRRHPNVISMNLVRRVEVGGHSLISLPGYHDPRYISEGNGCQYYGEDVRALEELFSDARGVPVVIAHGPPLSEGADAIDYAFDAGNVGDPALRALLDEQGVPYGVFGHILEAGGRVERVVSPQPDDRGAARLQFNAGTVGSIGSDTHEGGRYQGMAAILHLGADGGRVVFRSSP